MTEKYQIDLMHLQNELLGDIKNVENKIDAKIKKSNQVFEESKSNVERRLNYLENAYTVLLQRNQNKSNDNSEEKIKEIMSKIDLFKRKSEENYFRLENKINDLRNDLKDISYKYNKKFSDSFQIPGSIGQKAPFQNIREFLEHVNKKLLELLKGKDQYAIDLKKFKEKIDNNLSSNKNQFDMLERNINTKFDLQINDIDKKYDEIIKVIEQRINTMRIENGKYSYDLLAQTNDLNDKCNRIDEVLKRSLDEYNDEFIKYKNTFKKMNEKLNNFEEQYKSFEKKLILIKEQFLNNNQYNSKFKNLDHRIKELEKMFFTMRSENMDSICDENKNNNSNVDDGQSKKKDSFNFSKDIKGVSARNSGENANEPKINNIIYDSKFFKSRNYLNYSDKTFKSKNNFNRIRSGKIFNRFPFISCDKASKNEDVSNYLGRNNIMDLNKKKLEPTERLTRYKEVIDRLNKNHKRFKILGKNRQKESEELNNISNHNYNYLDKKIDILGKVMVDTFNKIISRVNIHQKNNNNNETNKTMKSKNKEEIKNNLDDSKKNLDNLNDTSYDKNRQPKILKSSNSFHLNLDLKIKSKLNPNSELLNNGKHKK